MRAVPSEAQRGREHEFEAQFGLPETLPAGEHILWQGQPEARWVARRIFHLPAIALYFLLMLTWRVAVLVHDGASWQATWQGSLMLALLSAVALGILAGLARLSASTTVYTLTNKRVVMRIGIVLTVTYNLPLKAIDGAHLVDLGQGAGEIALALRPDTRIAYLHLWPHARPWQLTRPQPMLRGLRDARTVSDRLMQAWSVANAQPAQATATQGPGADPGLRLASGALGSLTHGRQGA